MNKIINIFEGLTDNNQPAIYEKAISNGSVARGARVFAKGFDNQGNVSGYSITLSYQDLITGNRVISNRQVKTSKEVIETCQEFFAGLEFEE